MKVYVVALSGVFLATSAFAQPSSPAGNGEAAASTPSHAPEAANPSSEHAAPRQICRRIDSDVSRRLGSRLVCHTAQEWRELQNDS